MAAVRQILLSLLLIAAVVGGWYWYRGGTLSLPESAANVESRGASRPAGGGGFGGAPVPVVTAPVEIDDGGDTIRAIGTLGAAQAVTIFPQVTGTVAEILFKAGEQVAAGDVLIRLDDADQKVEVERATIARDDARAALERAERLLATKNITAVAVSDARSALHKAEIDLKIAELALAKRTISAPFAGVVGITDLSIGDLVTTTKPIANLDDMATARVSLEVPERVAAKIALGQTVTATSAALPDQTFTGAVSAIDNRVDATARTLKIEAELPNQMEVLKAGMSVLAVLEFPGEARPMVPSLALQWDRKGSFVWTLDGDTAHRTPVRIIARQNGSVVVAGDLKKDQEIVVEGVQRLREGLKVARVGNDDSPAAASAASAKAGS